MVKTIIQTVSTSLSSFMEFLPPGVVMSLLTAYVGEGKYIAAFRQEFVGTLLMIVCTFSAGKWVGKDSMYTAWGAHAMGVIAADYIGGGPMVNPAVTVGMWSLGKVSYTEGFVRIAAQLGGGLVAFPLFHALSEAMKMEPFGGPEFNIDDNDEAIEAFLSEFFATALLMWAIFILNWELYFGSYHYIIKQSLTAAAIRALIEFFPTAGPAMNPSTSWLENVFE
jgi:glycerol uptake facilitator-like aquaporin